MKKVLIITSIILLYIVVSAIINWYLRDTDWASIDTIGTSATPPPGAPPGNYVTCVIDGQSSIMLIEYCKKAKKQQSEMGSWR